MNFLYAGIRNILYILVQWCKDHGVEINVTKSAVMHIRKKPERRSEIRYMADGKEILTASSYKYLACVLGEHLELKDMVHDKVMTGKKALGAWFWQCRLVGNVCIGTFRKLMTSFVETSMLYGAEIWGCFWSLEALEQAQLRALCMFFGVGTLHLEYHCCGQWEICQWCGW